MCLLIDKKVRNNHHKENGYCVAYKIITNDNGSPFFNMYEYRLGINKMEKPSLSILSEKCVFEGLHLLLSLNEAKNYLKGIYYLSSPRYHYGKKIIKVYYKPEDVISYGHSVNSSNQFEKKQGKSVVVKSCLIMSLKPVPVFASRVKQ